jgi:hypothetical protein
MGVVMIANTIIMATYAICVTFAAVHFNDPGILGWYILLGFIGFSYKTGGEKDGK